MPDETQFAIATALLNGHGGRPEVAWDLAGELISEGVELRALFIGMADIESRMNVANAAVLAAQR
jgi:hypothetical protein